MDLHRKMIIYNLFPLLAGPFKDWPSHLERASGMGFNWVFVNVVQRPGASGSLYSIADYHAVNPFLLDPRSTKAPEEQVGEVVRVAEEMGLGMMVDLVVNHCAVDSTLVGLHPEWFLREEDGAIAHPFASEGGKKVVWKDLAKFDHENTPDPEGLFQYFLGVVGKLIQWGFKGFRCDAAYQVPESFWERLIRETKRLHPHVLFLAETLGCPPQQTKKTARAGFDYIFNSSKWWDFDQHWLMEQYMLTREIAPSVSFPESHDTVRLCEELDGNVAGLEQRYLFAALFSAGVMMPMGFEFGFRRKLHVVETRPADWEETSIDLTGFIREVNKIKAEHPVFQEDGVTEILQHDNRRVLLMWKACAHDREECLLVLSKDIHGRQPFHADRLQDCLQSGAPLVDVSPSNRLSYIPAPFSYEFLPGQGIVLTASCDLLNGL
jgi:starch synthase (maltosyl-transferring)